MHCTRSKVHGGSGLRLSVNLLDLQVIQTYACQAGPSKSDWTKQTPSNTSSTANEAVPLEALVIELIDFIRET